MTLRNTSESSPAASGTTSIEEAVWAILRGPKPDPDSKKYREAVAELRARVERTAHRMVRRGVEVDDIVQEALQSTIRYAHKHSDPPKNLDGFLYNRIRYVVKELVRAARHQETLDDERVKTLAAVIVRPTEALEDQEQREALAQCATELTAARADVWHRTYGQNMDAEEAAQDLGITVNALRVRLHHARAAVVECLKRKGVLAS